MTHEFAKYTPEEQTEVLSIVKKMEWEPKVGDCFVTKRISHGRRIQIVKVSYHKKVKSFFLPEEEFRVQDVIWLPQVIAYLERYDIRIVAGSIERNQNVVENSR